MTWRVVIPGQPPSVNRMYTRVRGDWNRMAKRTEVATYQRDVTLLVQAARPSGWHPSGQIRLIYDFYLRRDADCDNLLKALNDAIQIALGVNDRLFLPCVRSKRVDGTIHDPRVAIEIGEASPSASPDPTGSDPNRSGNPSAPSSANSPVPRSSSSERLWREPPEPSSR